MPAAMRMPFFEQQQAARQLTRRLILLFGVGMLSVTLAISAVMLTLAATLSNGLFFFRLPDAAWLQTHPAALISTALFVWGVTGSAVLLKRMELRAGGGSVARALGGERIDADSRDPLYQRLRNVVEEMAIASGIAAPEVYVLPREAGINAFAAGWSPATAALAVTRGALEQLTRDELQGVVAHEFSHVVNNDIRLNQQLIAWLYGLMALSVLGRGLWRVSISESGGKRSGFPPVLIAAAAVMALGYVGMLFGRLIQAAVARGRESLADASAVQFTRNPDGLRGALLKIAASTDGAELREASADEFAHLLFFPQRAQWFATHPPLAERVRALGGAFDATEIQRLRARLHQADGAGVSNAGAAPAFDATLPSQPDAIASLRADTTLLPLAEIAYRPGALAMPQLRWAEAMRASLPSAIIHAASHADDAAALLLALSISLQPAVRSQQVAVIRTRLAASGAGYIEEMLGLTDTLQSMQRQPVLQLLLPQLRQLPVQQRVQLSGCLNAVLHCNATLDVSSYALCKLAQAQLHDAFVERPERKKPLTLAQTTDALLVLLSVLARAGHQQPELARQAYERAAQQLGLRTYAPLAQLADWPAQLDRALLRLDRLQPMAKQMLVEAMLIAVAHDEQLSLQELELLRTFSACLHHPLPLTLTDRRTQS